MIRDRGPSAFNFPTDFRAVSRKANDTLMHGAESRLALELWSIRTHPGVGKTRSTREIPETVKCLSDPHPRAPPQSHGTIPVRNPEVRQSLTISVQEMAEDGYKSGRCLMDWTSASKVKVNINASQSPSASVYCLRWQGKNRCPSSLFSSHSPRNRFRV